MHRNDDIVFGSPLRDIAYTPRPAAYGVFVSKSGEVAFVEGVRGYFLPGGGADDGEAPEETLIREVREELGCETALGERIGTVTQYFVADDGAYRMAATFITGELIGEPSGEAEHRLRWTNPHETGHLFYHECHRWAIRRVIGQPCADSR